MKKTVLLLCLLLISLHGSATHETSSVSGTLEKNEPQNQIIIVGAFKTEQFANRQVKRLSAVMSSDPEIVRLQEDNGFEYLAKPSGDYFVVAIEPLSGNETIRRVLAAAKKAFPDAYVHIRKHTPQELQKAQETPASVQETPVPAQEAAPVSAVVAPEPAAVPEKPETAEVVPVAAEKKTAPAMPAPAAAEASSPSASSDEMLIYAAAGAAVLILLLLVLMRKKAKTQPVVEETGDVRAPETGETPVETAAVIEEPVLPEAAAPVEEAPAEAPDAAEAEAVAAEPAASEPSEETVSPQPQEPEQAPAPLLSRKKRQPRTDREKVVKEDFCDFSGERLLVAEDNLINQKVIVKMLADSGIEVVIANDGQEALDILAGDSDFRLILMDAHMPNVDGFEATRIIRANPQYDHIAVSALSGDVAADDIRKMQEAGMEAQLEKPLRMDALYDVMYTYFDLPGEEAAPAGSAADDSDELHASEGLDISGGDKALYMEILHEFVEMYGGSDAVIGAHLANGDLDAAKALMLDISGIAANIGADQLAETAGKLREALLANDESEYMALNQRYKEHLQALLIEIDKIS